MLEAVLTHLNNWFCREVYSGTFTVTGGKLELPDLANGQYFRIVGSVFNDGLHQNPAVYLLDETFTGAVWILAIPKTVIDLSEEIKDWTEKNQPSAYTSESFGGYSYTRGTNKNGKPVGWKDVFSDRLSPYKKIGNFVNVVPNGAGTPPFPKNDFWR